MFIYRGHDQLHRKSGKAGRNDSPQTSKWSGKSVECCKQQTKVLVGVQKRKWSKYPQWLHSWMWSQDAASP